MVDPNTPSTYAYLDAFSGGPGGLGVTKDVNASLQADPSSDDNVSSAAGGGEVVGFSLSRSALIGGFTFHDEGHKLYFNDAGDSKLNYTLDGGNSWSISRIWWRTREF